LFSFFLSAWSVKEPDFDKLCRHVFGSHLQFTKVFSINCAYTGSLMQSQLTMTGAYTNQTKDKA
jgi:hypothetical protein